MKKMTRNTVAVLGVAGLLSLGVAAVPAHASTSKTQTNAAADHLISICLTIKPNPALCIVV